MKIVLIGFMGTGKSVVGKQLSQELSMKLFDMDYEIEKSQKRSISDIFKKDGEEYFRKLETNLLKELLKYDDIIISTGGGIVTLDENLKLLEIEKKVIFLDGDAKTIQQNVHKEINKRPLLKESKNVYKTIEGLLKNRYCKYEKVCDIKIDINDKNIQEVVSEILVSIR